MSGAWSNRMSGSCGRCPRRRALRAQAHVAQLGYRKRFRLSPSAFPSQRAGAVSFPGRQGRPLFPLLHAGASETGATSASGRAGGQAGGAGLPGRGRGRHFRSGPRVSPERRRLLRLLGLLPAETPAPVSDGARGPGAWGKRGWGVPPWPTLVPRMSLSVPLSPGPLQGSTVMPPVRPFQTSAPPP